MPAIRKICFALAAAILPAAVSISASAQVCIPPPGFVDLAPPAITSVDQLVSHTEEIIIDRPLVAVLSSLDRPLKDTIHKAGGLPGVSGDSMLTKGVFGSPGSRRLTCLTDGSTLEEQVLERQKTGSSFRFRYVVWNYTSAQARPIEYGVGDFLYTDMGGGRTHVVWIYSFKLNEQRFPGYLGAIGQYLFRVAFLDREYAAMMRGTLDGTKKNAEQ
jgi:hypothetical protein